MLRFSSTQPERGAICLDGELPIAGALITEPGKIRGARVRRADHPGLRKTRQRLLVLTETLIAKSQAEPVIERPLIQRGQHEIHPLGGGDFSFREAPTRMGTHTSDIGLIKIREHAQRAALLEKPRKDRLGVFCRRLRSRRRPGCDAAHVRNDPLI